MNYVYHPIHGHKVVNDAEYYEHLNTGWYDTPAKFPKPGELKEDVKEEIKDEIKDEKPAVRRGRQSKEEKTNDQSAIVIAE